jgi:hypothetical protein
MAFFGKKETITNEPETLSTTPVGEIIVLGELTPENQSKITSELGSESLKTIQQLPQALGLETKYLLLMDATVESLATAASLVVANRRIRKDGFPTFLVSVSPKRLTEFGKWLSSFAQGGELEGLRLWCESSGGLPRDLKRFAGPALGQDLVKMPISPEIPNSPVKPFFALSPESRRTISFVGELAENDIARVYLLGAPGAGKTSLAYYYFLKRAKGNFVTVNLNSESTGDKASMKSLLCGHVAGSMPGAQTREGALSFARDGVCFLDESHGATGSVMQVLMEVLENSQFLPFGATSKRPVECAVLFASNRSWETLRGLMHIDEHARLGATIIEISDLKYRREDLIGVLAVTLAKMAGKFKTWKAPKGLSKEALEMVYSCNWRGNVRSLMRVIESAVVAFASTHSSGDEIGVEHIRPALELWEPADSKDAVDYASFGAAA